MRIYTHKGIYGEGESYVMETLEDFDEYEKILKDRDSLKYNPNFYEFKEDFKKYIGKIWEDRDNIRYCFNGTPVYPQYKLIAIEDDSPNADWYWVAQNVDDDRDFKYLLCNCPDTYDWII